MTTSSLDKHLYDDLTWEEINEAVLARKVILLPIGSTEQHGRHLPLDVDNFLARSACLEAAKLAPREILVMPTIPYGYNEHALDFPGTIHVHYDHFIEYALDVVKSIAYAGFDRIVVVDGHGSNEHLCEFIARRATLETDALVASTMWTNLTVEAFESVRESGPGGAAHACELETSAYLYLDPSRVQMDKAEDHFGGAAGSESSRFLHVDLTQGWGPVKVVRWTSSATPTGVSGAPTLATAEKGRAIVQAAAKNLVAFVREFRAMDRGERRDHRVKVPGLPTLPSLD
ncbi:creatininase family protein [Candidatus Poribacteria bacterium]|nr:creatininase family protein [Candidatus Poribacteria bacterium]